MNVPTVPEVETAIGITSEKWVARCYEIAVKVLEAKLVTGRAEYGLWSGPVAPGTFFAGRPIHLSRHGWIRLEDGSVVDPTRWVFEGKPPYIYHGPADHYDLGASALRKAIRRPIPDGPDLDIEKVWEFTETILPSGTGAWPHVEKVLEIDITQQPPGFLSKDQIIYLANLSLEELQPHAKAIYQALYRLGFGAMIPVDLRFAVFHDEQPEGPLRANDGVFVNDDWEVTGY